MRHAAIALAALVCALSGVPSADALTVGYAVSGVGSSTKIGTYDENLDLGGDDTNTIKYFIPLTASPPATCVYGVDCGTSADSGAGGTVMSMFLYFHPVSEIDPQLLEINFEDLDLINASDPDGFLESLRIFDADGNPLTELIDDIDATTLVTGDADTQQLLALGLGIISTPFYAELKFAASSTFYGTNTPEYLYATVRDCVVGVDPGCVTQQNPVPLPAALPLFATALGGLGLLGWRRRRRAAVED